MKQRRGVTMWPQTIECLCLQSSIAFLLSFLLWGCASLPEVKLPFDGTLAGSDKAVDARTYDTTWWEELNDPAINALVDKAFSSNPTLEQALARIDEASAQLGMSRSEYFPTLGVSAGITHNHDGSVDRGERSRTTFIGPSLSWELDLFGRVRKSNKAALSRLDVRTADAQGTRIMLASGVATTTLDFRACQSSCLVLESDLASRKQTLGLLDKKMQAGFSAQTDVDSARRDLAFATIELALQNELCQKNLNGLSAFSGVERPSIQKLIAGPNIDEIELSMPEPPLMPEDIQASALLNYPSVRSAASEARAAWVDIDVAKAERLPTLNLSTIFAGQWIRAAGTTLDFATWALGATATGTVFDGGLGAAKVDVAEARYRGALAALEGVLRTAIQETQDALAAQRSANERREAAMIALKAAQSSFTANEALWRNGSASLLELEYARRQLLAAQTDLITAKRDRAAAWITLHRVLGEPINSESETDEEH